LFFLLIPPPPLTTLFPYTTLFRSSLHRLDILHTLPKLPQLHCNLHDCDSTVWLRTSHTAHSGDSLSLLVTKYDHTLRIRSQTLQDRKSTRLNSSHVKISYAVFCLK